MHYQVQGIRGNDIIGTMQYSSSEKEEARAMAKKYVEKYKCHSARVLEVKCAETFYPDPKEETPELKPRWTFTANSQGYMIYFDGKPQGGAGTMEKPKGRAARKCAEGHADTALGICRRNNAEGKVPAQKGE